jgi:preprotein translocase subunit SecF
VLLQQQLVFIVAIFAALFAILWFPIKEYIIVFLKIRKKREEDLTQKIKFYLKIFCVV